MRSQIILKVSKMRDYILISLWLIRISEYFVTQILLIYFNRHVPKYIQTLLLPTQPTQAILLLNRQVPELLP